MADAPTSDRPVRHTRRLSLGTRDVYTHGLPRRFWGDLYHFTMTVSWPGLIASLAAFYVSVNLVFGVLYAFEPESIANLRPSGYLGAFFFSIETFATVGYGDMHPQTLYGHVVATTEIFAGMLCIALLTGVMFARFSQPRSRILFGRRGVVRPYEGQLTLMFRVANARQNVIVDAAARLRLLRMERSVEGLEQRRIHDLALVRDTHPMLILTWNIMHVIGAASPLAGATPDSLAAQKAFFVLTLQGTDETTGQSMMARTVFTLEQLRWNHAFAEILHADAAGIDHVDYTRFHDVEPL
jgi:inward rectifier potassium channel